MNPFQVYNWQLAHGKTLELGARACVMGILNVTPDSFSDGGRFTTIDNAVKQAEKMVEEGAVIVDVGGESTRPGSDPITAEEEQSRVLPVIEALLKRDVPLVSIDTYRASTARMAIEAGAHVINDVWGFQKDPDIAEAASATGAGICAMHTGRERQKENDVVKDQMAFLGKSLDVLKRAGVREEAIVLDPGFGFAKDPVENAELLARLDELHELGFPLLIGTSRKRFIGHYTGRDDANRDIGTAATSVVARMKGGAIFRVHDVAANVDALAIADAVLTRGAG